MMEETRETRVDEWKLIREASCLKCAHLPVCSIYRAITPLINSLQTPNTDSDTRPFLPDELAKICKYYTPPEVALVQP